MYLPELTASLKWRAELQCARQKIEASVVLNEVSRGRNVSNRDSHQTHRVDPPWYSRESVRFMQVHEVRHVSCSSDDSRLEARCSWLWACSALPRRTRCIVRVGHAFPASRRLRAFRVARKADHEEFWCVVCTVFVRCCEVRDDERLCRLLERRGIRNDDARLMLR